MKYGMIFIQIKIMYKVYTQEWKNQLEQAIHQKNNSKRKKSIQTRFLNKIHIYNKGHNSLKFSPQSSTVLHICSKALPAVAAWNCCWKSKPRCTKVEWLIILSPTNLAFRFFHRSQKIIKNYFHENYVYALTPKQPSPSK